MSRLPSGSTAAAPFSITNYEALRPFLDVVNGELGDCDETDDEGQARHEADWDGQPGGGDAAEVGDPFSNPESIDLLGDFFQVELPKK